MKKIRFGGVFGQSHERFIRRSLDYQSCIALNILIRIATLKRSKTLVMMNTLVKQQIPVPSGAFAEKGSGGIHLETSHVQANIFQHV